MAEREFEGKIEGKVVSAIVVSFFKFSADLCRVKNLKKAPFRLFLGIFCKRSASGSFKYTMFYFIWPPFVLSGRIISDTLRF